MKFHLMIYQRAELHGEQNKSYLYRACLLYTSEQLIFPEIEYDKIDKLRGMDITFVTTAETDEEAKELLTLMGAPFTK